MIERSRRSGNGLFRYTYWDVVGDFRGFAADVARLVRKDLSPLFNDRLKWMTTLPPGHLNRRGEPSLGV